MSNECEKVNGKCQARNERRKTKEKKSQEQIDKLEEHCGKQIIEMRRLDIRIDGQDEEIEELNQRVTDLEGKPKILTGFEMMKVFLLDTMGFEFLNSTPTTEAGAKADVKACRNALAEHFDNVDLPWPDSMTRHYDAFRWNDPDFGPVGTTNEKIIDFVHDQEALKPIVDKWQWQEVE